MNYFELRQKKLPIGSDIVEAVCKNLIGARLKKSGKRWSIDGGQTFLTLRALVLSNRWEHLWSFFLRRHFPEARKSERNITRTPQRYYMRLPCFPYVARLTIFEKSTCLVKNSLAVFLDPPQLFSLL